MGTRALLTAEANKADQHGYILGKRSLSQTEKKKCNFFSSHHDRNHNCGAHLLMFFLQSRKGRMPGHGENWTACIPASFSPSGRSLRCNSVYFQCGCSRRDVLVGVSCRWGVLFFLTAGTTHSSHWPRRPTTLTLSSLGSLGRAEHRVRARVHPANKRLKQPCADSLWMVSYSFLFAPTRLQHQYGGRRGAGRTGGRGPNTAKVSHSVLHRCVSQPTAQPCQNHSTASSGWFWRLASAAGRRQPPGCTTARQGLRTSRRTRPRWPASPEARSAWSPPWPGCSTGCRPGVQLRWRNLGKQTDGSTAQKHRGENKINKKQVN